LNLSKQRSIYKYKQNSDIFANLAEKYDTISLAGGRTLFPGPGHTATLFRLPQPEVDGFLS
jgi:hypothetical protein